MARGLSKIAFSDKVWAQAGTEVPGSCLHSSACLRFSTHPSWYNGTNPHAPHTCLESPLWIYLKLLLLQGWDVLELPKSTSAPPITTPSELLGAPRGRHPELHPSRTLGCQRGHVPLSKARIQNGFIPGGTLLCFYVFNSLDSLSAA